MPNVSSLAPGYTDETLLPYFCLSNTILVLLFIANFHKLFTEQVKCYCYHYNNNNNDDVNNNINNNNNNYCYYYS